MEKYTLGKYKQNKFKNLVAILTFNTWTLRKFNLPLKKKNISTRFIALFRCSYN